MGVKILKVNPPYIKVHNQYVECCCTEDKQTKLLRKLVKVVGVTDVAIIAEPESLGIILL
jgi:EAL domain-containing protein (putative c-di-GMP-specific phosphodiesterase class I)